MKKIFILLALIAVYFQANCLFSEDIDDYVLVQNKIRGGYKTCTVYDFEYKFGEPDLASKKLDCIYTFDNNGNKIEILRYNISNSKEFIQYKDTYKYNNNENRIEWIIYDKSGLICQMYKYRYDDNGNRIETVSYDTNGNVKSKYVCKYDFKGNLIEHGFYPANDEWKITYNYNTDGKVIEKEDNYGKITYKYDEKGNNVAEELQNFTSENFTFTYEYDKIGNKTAKYCKNSDGISSLNNTYKYDVYRNLIEQIQYNQFGEPWHKTEYIYTK